MKAKKRVLGVLTSNGGKARETYETAADHLGRATDVLRGKEDSRMLGKVGTLLIGLGIGVGVGLLIAPVSG